MEHKPQLNLMKDFFLDLSQEFCGDDVAQLSAQNCSMIQRTCNVMCCQHVPHAASGLQRRSNLQQACESVKKLPPDNYFALGGGANCKKQIRSVRR